MKDLPNPQYSGSGSRRVKIILSYIVKIQRQPGLHETLYQTKQNKASYVKVFPTARYDILKTMSSLK